MFLVTMSLCAIDMQTSSGLKRFRPFDMNDYPDLDIAFNFHNEKGNDGSNFTVREDRL